MCSKHCERIERATNDLRKMEMRQSDWLMHTDRTCMAASVVRIDATLMRNCHETTTYITPFMWIINQLGIFEGIGPVEFQFKVKRKAKCT